MSIVLSRRSWSGSETSSGRKTTRQRSLSLCQTMTGRIWRLIKWLTRGNLLSKVCPCLASRCYLKSRMLRWCRACKRLPHIHVTHVPLAPMTLTATTLYVYIYIYITMSLLRRWLWLFLAPMTLGATTLYIYIYIFTVYIYIYIYYNIYIYIYMYIPHCP